MVKYDDIIFLNRLKFVEDDKSDPPLRLSKKCEFKKSI